jgi:hypothetical protein
MYFTVMDLSSWTSGSIFMDMWIFFAGINNWAGYSKDYIPADLSAACMELAAWNFNRYRSKRIGTTGNIKGAGKEGEHFEMGMPENVQQILEPYKRKLI